MGKNDLMKDNFTFSSSAGIGPFISVFSKYKTVDNSRKERKVAGCT